jgi:hypothetical protein
MSYDPEGGGGEFDNLSAPREELPQPKGCWIYEPDNHDDYQCLVLWQPAPELGARQWTLFGQRILIGVYRDEGRYGLSETNVVFRLLPSFRVVPVSVILDILESSNPDLNRHTVALTDIASGSVKLVSEIDLRQHGAGVDHRQHRQQFDELRKPLRQEYDARGNVILPKLRFSKHENASLYLAPPLVDQHVPHASNATLPVYDYYSRLLAPTDVFYDPDSVDGLGYGDDYDGQFEHDVFGDFVVGARANNTLITRKPVQPLEVDHHNTPLKRPSRRG